MVKIVELPEADSLSIDGWDMDNDQQQAYIEAVNRHLIEAGGPKGEHGIIGCGIYRPWVVQTDQWAEAIQKAEAATGYRASWHWNIGRGDNKNEG